MPRPRDPRRDKAFHLWEESGGSKKLKDIAEELGVISNTVRKWKANDKWGKKRKGALLNRKGALLFVKVLRKVTKTPKGIEAVHFQKEIKTLCELVSMNQFYLISWMIQKKSCSGGYEAMNKTDKLLESLTAFIQKAEEDEIVRG